jgi:N-acetylmuramoyl-L-alanine amidase
MKLGASMFLLLATLFALPARGEPPRSDRAAPASRTYVRLNDWAQANSFAVRWLERNRTLQLSNRTARLVFNVDPRRDLRRLWINGVQVWLALPLLNRNGTISISQLDLDATLRPALSRPTGRFSTVKTICLDPGHGGKDPGFRVGANEEQRYTLLLAREVREQLRRAGFNVFLTRNADIFVSREARPEMARRGGADLFVSLHFNATETGRNEVKGVEVYCCTPAGATSFNAGGEGDTRWVTGNRCDENNLRLAYQMQKSLVNGLPAADRGVKRARFQVLREATMPAILIEGGFMSHPAEGKKIYDAAYRERMAGAIVEGILAYKRLGRG